MADTKVSDLIGIGFGGQSVTDDDYIYLVNDGSGTPASRKVLISELKLALGSIEIPIGPLIVTSGSQALIDFTSIPQTFRHLRVKCRVRDTQAGTNAVGLRCRLNGDVTAGDYTSTSRSESANGVAVVSLVAASAIGVYMGLSTQDGNAADLFCYNVIDIPFYAETNWNKLMTYVATCESTTGGMRNGSGQARWKSNNAVNRVTIGGDGVAFKDGSEAQLYGLLY